MTQKYNPPTHPTILQRAKEMRHQPTLAESKLWLTLRTKQLGRYKFRRQHPIGRFIVIRHGLKPAPAQKKTR